MQTMVSETINGIQTMVSTQQTMVSGGPHIRYRMMGSVCCRGCENIGLTEGSVAEGFYQ